MSFENLDEFAEATINLFDKSNIEHKRNEKKKELVIYFYYKQREHLINFIKIKNTFDAQAILKTMLEGCALLTYFLQSKENFEKWDAWSDIENLKILELKKIEKTNEFSYEIKRNAHKWNNYLKSKSISKEIKDIRSADFNRIIPPMKELIASIKNEFSYFPDFYSIYDICCKWTHWNPIGFSSFIDEKDNILSINLTHPSQKTIYEMAVLCLLITSLQFNDILSIKDNDELERFSNSFVDYYSNRIQ